MDAPVHIMTKPIILGPHPSGPLPPADYTRASQDGVRAWADLLGRAALRLRTPAGQVTALAEAVAVVLDQEAESAAECPGFICPPRITHEACQVDEHCGAIDEPEEIGTIPTHHHCAWCNALRRQWEEDEPPMVRLARAVLEVSA